MICVVNVDYQGTNYTICTAYDVVLLHPHVVHIDIVQFRRTYLNCVFVSE